MGSIEISGSGLKGGAISTGEIGIISEEAGGISVEIRAGSDVFVSFSIFWGEVVE